MVEGLIHYCDFGDLDAKFEGLKSIWDQRCPKYHDWFRKNRLKKLKENVILSKEGYKGLYDPFYNNAIESKHNETLSAGKKLPLDRALTHIKDILDGQDNSIKLSIVILLGCKNEEL